ncbi:autotransporter-associated beta strand repeat-containing protein [Humisphaera borealis]|uniref:Autotransporter-associated beta strand repeat-containing protein n=1 Tax=Humisphaera borealis TaxID=2807512 RepID=A0A7M2WYX5_9BACT|nr:autotransporter-associated beta strand repeat-containing protein [Humisphaera borealis]QOV90675.1 autotransporter-associated beta strand repeat-containing protein [Humisphaera borealis]
MTFNPTSQLTWEGMGVVSLRGRVTLNLTSAYAADSGSFEFASGSFSSSFLITGGSGEPLSRAISFSAADISGGTQTIGVDHPGAGSTTFAGTIATDGSNNTVALFAAAEDTAAFTGVMSGARPMQKTGPGNVDLLPSSSTISGKWTILEGLISTTGESKFGANPASFTVDQITLNGGGIWANTSPIEFNSNRGLTLGANGGSFDTSGGTITLTNVVAGTAGGSLTKIGSGTLVLAGAHTYDGPTNVQRGTIQLAGDSNRLPAGTVVNLGTAAAVHLGTLDLNGLNQQIAGLNSVVGVNATASNNTVISAAAATLTIAGSGTYSFGAGTNANSGVITGAIALVKQGSGTQILGDANTYTGGTTITGGVLRADNGITGSATGSGAVAVNSGGTLSGTGRVVNTAGPVAINTGGKLAPGATVGNLTTNAQQWNAGGIYVWEIQDAAGDPINGAGINWDSTAVNGTLTVAPAGAKFTIKLTTLNAGVAGQAVNFNPSQGYVWTIARATTIAGGPVDASRFELDTSAFQNAFDGTFDINSSGGNVRLTYAPVPEPGALLSLAGFGAIGILGRRRRRDHANLEVRPIVINQRAQGTDSHRPT